MRYIQTKMMTTHTENDKTVCIVFIKIPNTPNFPLFCLLPFVETGLKKQEKDKPPVTAVYDSTQYPHGTSTAAHTVFVE